MTAVTHATTPGRPAAVGVALFVSAAAWMAVSGFEAGTTAGASAAMILGAGLVVAIAVLATRRHPTLIPIGVVGAAFGLLLFDVKGTVGAGPLKGLLGYANATAAFFAQAAVAALMLVAEGRTKILRIAGSLATVAFMSVVVLSRSWTAGLLLPLMVLLAFLVRRARGDRSAVAVAGASFVIVFVLTVGLGAVGPAGLDGRLATAVGATISEDRVALWHDALSIVADEPVFGVGPGRFVAASPFASSDEDLRFAHHEFLQAGAESGLPGSSLAVAIFLWGFAALWLGPPSRTAVLSAVGLALLGMHASVDYVLHFPAVTLAGAAVLGGGLGAARRVTVPGDAAAGGPA